MDNVVETSQQNKPIDENVLEFLMLLIEADIEAKASSIGDKENKK